MTDLYHRFVGHDAIASLLEGSDEDVLVALRGRPALVRIPGTAGSGRARLVSCLLHGNEDSGLRAALAVLRERRRFPFDLLVFIGNVRAATSDGWFAHRYLDEQEDFNRVWGLGAPTTRMRRCADGVLEELRAADLEAAVDVHNNTGENPAFGIVPVATADSLDLAARCTDVALLWNRDAHTLMEALGPTCPAIALECGVAGLPASTAAARGMVERFLAAPLGDAARSLADPARLYEVQAVVTVRPEVPFAFGGALTDAVDLVLVPGLDAANFGMLLAGTPLGHVEPGTAMPLCALDLRGGDVTDRYFRVEEDGTVVTASDLTPAMMTTTVVQARRDCLFYVTRRRR